jgi:hypothetical protein
MRISSNCGTGFRRIAPRGPIRRLENRGLGRLLRAGLFEPLAREAAWPSPLRRGRLGKVPDAPYGRQRGALALGCPEPVAPGPSENVRPSRYLRTDIENG